MDEEAAAAFLGDSNENEVFEVEPDNWIAVQTFLACATQWRIGLLGPTGLDYPALEAVMRLRAIDDTEDTFERVRALEGAALAVFSKRRK